MSGRLVSLVFDSDLPSWLKPYAAALATFAADDGSQVFPSVGRVARMVGRSARSAQRAMHALRARGVIVLEAPPGYHRAPRYRFRAVALPQVGDPDQLVLCPQAKTSKRSASSGFAQFPQALTGHRRPHMGDTSDTRSVSDPSLINHQRARTRDEGKRQKTGTEDQ